MGWDVGGDKDKSKIVDLSTGTMGMGLVGDGVKTHTVSALNEELQVNAQASAQDEQQRAIEGGPLPEEMTPPANFENVMGKRCKTDV